MNYRNVSLAKSTLLYLGPKNKILLTETAIASFLGLLVHKAGLLCGIQRGMAQILKEPRAETASKTCVVRMELRLLKCEQLSEPCETERSPFKPLHSVARLTPSNV